MEEILDLAFDQPRVLPLGRHPGEIRSPPPVTFRYSCLGSRVFRIIPWRVIPWRVSGRGLVRAAGCALHKLPRSAERHREAADQYEGQIGNEIRVVWIQDECDG